MLLKCVDNHGWRGLKTGETYEVAEILGMPEHVMARRRDARKWPRPGDPHFGLHLDEYFAEPPGEIDVARCDYDACSSVFFGVRIARTKDIAAFRTLDRAVFPLKRKSLDPMDFDDWRRRMRGRGYSRARLKGWYDLVLGDLPIHWWYHRNIRPPDDGMRAFLEFGIEPHTMVKDSITWKAGKEIVESCLSRIGIRPSDIGLHAIEHWERRRRSGWWRS
jgi:hypothetical protein